jgi:phospholipid-binding lipoprotein MlaA
MKLAPKLARAAVAVVALALVAGCATQRSPSPADPIEPVNRAVFEFNEQADRFVFKPVAQGYRFVLPDFVRAGVRNFFENLRDPWIAVNQLLQGKVEDGLNDTFRFIANSTFGLGGLLDIATDMRLVKHSEDFGQTLGAWGVGDGPYLVLPILGPSNVRDGVGLIADAYGYLPWQLPKWLSVEHQTVWQNSLTALDFVNIRANLLDATNVLEEAALDRYAFVREAYIQRRRNLIYDGNPPAITERTSAAPAVPDLATEGSREPSRALRPAAPAAPGTGAAFVDPKVPGNYLAVLSAGPAIPQRADRR